MSEYPLSDAENMGRHGFVRCPVGHGPEPCEVCDSTGWVRKDSYPSNDLREWPVSLDAKGQIHQWHATLKPPLVVVPKERAQVAEVVAEGLRFSERLLRLERDECKQHHTEAVAHGRAMRQERDDALSLLTEWLDAAQRIEQRGLVEDGKLNGEALSILEDNTRALLGDCGRPKPSEPSSSEQPSSLAVPGLDQEMPPRRRPTRPEAFERVKSYLYAQGMGSGDEAVTNAHAEALVTRVLEREPSSSEEGA